MWDLSGMPTWNIATRTYTCHLFAHYAIETQPFRIRVKKEWTKGKWIFLVLRRSADGQTDGLTRFKGTSNAILLFFGPVVTAARPPPPLALSFSLSLSPSRVFSFLFIVVVRRDATNRSVFISRDAPTRESECRLCTHLQPFDMQ